MDNSSNNYDSLEQIIEDRQDLIVPQRKKYLTKSKYINALQCHKYLWMRCNRPEDIPEPSKSLQHIFSVGKEIGQLAQKRFPGGINISEEDFFENLKTTKALLRQSARKPLYEAGIAAGRLYARADILYPVDNEAWDLVEVKCSTCSKEIKNVYYHDIAFQKYCYEKAGLKIRKCLLMHINKEYIRDGEIDVNDFFTLQDLTEAVGNLQEGIDENVEGLLKLIDMSECFNCSIHEGCRKPYECPLIGECWKSLPAYNIFQLYNMRWKSRFDFFNRGLRDIKDTPKGDKKIKEKHLIQIESVETGQSHIEPSGISDFLKGLQYPIYYMDFETTFEAIPPFKGMRPYQQMPFQFSVHVQDSPGGGLKHFSFLWRKPSDPRKNFIQVLKDCLGSQGSIVAYYFSFEKSRLNELVELFPEYKDWVDSILVRMVDLLEPFKKFHYYHASQKGSASIKKVLPAITGKGYEGMAISDGGEASLEYARVSNGDIPEDEKNEAYSALEKYCSLDTEGMAWIVEELRKMGENPSPF